jgi:hypothetical protein
MAVQAAATRSDPRPIATLHDCGYSVTPHLTRDEPAKLTQTVAVVAPVQPLTLLDADSSSFRVRAVATWMTVDVRPCAVLLVDIALDPREDRAGDWTLS